MNRKALEKIGTEFERVVASYLRANFSECKVIHNLEIYSAYLKKNTQIDIIFIHPKLVCVIELKNWTRYVSGSYDDANWKGKSRSTNTLYHPNIYYQNLIHIRALRNMMRLQRITPVPCENLICFPDGTDLLTECTECCTLSQLCYRLRTLIENSQITIDVDSTYKVIESLDVRN